MKMNLMMFKCYSFGTVRVENHRREIYYDLDLSSLCIIIPQQHVSVLCGMDGNDAFDTYTEGIDTVNTN